MGFFLFLLSALSAKDSTDLLALLSESEQVLYFTIRLIILVNPPQGQPPVMRSQARRKVIPHSKLSNDYPESTQDYLPPLYLISKIYTDSTDQNLVHFTPFPKDSHRPRDILVSSDMPGLSTET